MPRISMPHAALCVRSFAYVALAGLVSVIFLPFYLLILLPARYNWPVLRVYLRIHLLLLRWICGIRYDLQGRENLPHDACILASRHEAVWETMYLPYALDNPAVFLKSELLRMPLVGPLMRKLGHIGIERSGNPEAVRKSFAAARKAVNAGRSVLIFPNGTRDPKHRFRVLPGISVLYQKLNLPVVPIVLNSGDHWIYNSWLRRPGTITVRILPPIPVRLPVKTFVTRLQHDLSQPACTE